ncbi:Hypothetical predicted protein [Mytilus galloprovincialis]|uniref:Uncharacterized protein n=1 Tax=Mytilus galloprovincialis TaxID=29158 RepID=A0A8B6BG42_MYTGA|nr:Hypothetical predicted protein [Mytilus galloprovincialis]
MEIRTTHSPHLRFVCNDRYAAKHLIDTSRFSVNSVPGKCPNDSYNKLIITVCILQPDKSGKLTTKDKELLERLIWREPAIDVNTVLYVIDTTQYTLSTLNYCSQEISKTVEPFSVVNTVFKRLFQIESFEISVRISLYFEKILLDKLPIKIKNIAAIEKMLKSTKFAKETSKKLSEGLLESSTCQTFLRREAVDYRLEGEQFLRLP